MPRMLVWVLPLVVGCATTGAPNKSAEPARPVDVVVVGGGLAGLVTAYELEKHGVSVQLLEASDMLGGRVQTANYGQGLWAEYGMQELWQGNPLLDIAAELGLGIDPGKPAYSSLYADGKLEPFTQESWEQFFEAIFTPSERAALSGWMREAKELAAAAESKGLADPAVRDLQDISFAQWIAQKKLPPKVATWIRLTIECELASDWERFSALFGLLEFHVFYDGGVENFHITGGNSRLIEALAGAIRGPKTLSAVVTAIRREEVNGRTRATVSYTRHNRTESVVAQRVVLAVPFTRIHQIQIDPPLSDDRWQALYTLSFGQYVVVHFLVDKAVLPLFKVSPSDLFTVLSNGPLGVIYGIQEPSPPEVPLEVFSLLIYGEPARAFHMAPREAKVKELLGDLDAIWPGFSAHVKSTHTYGYHPAALPVWPPGRSPLDEGSELLRKPVLGLHLAGDYTLNAHSDGAARSGLRVAREIAAELGKK